MDRDTLSTTKVTELPSGFSFRCPTARFSTYDLFKHHVLNQHPDAQLYPAFNLVLNMTRVSTAGRGIIRRPTPRHGSAAEIDPSEYTERFVTFITQNPTVFHAVAHYADRLSRNGFIKLSEREGWQDKLGPGGKYFVERNGSTLIAFIIGKSWTPGQGVAVIAGHADSLTSRRKCLDLCLPTTLPGQLG